MTRYRKLPVEIEAIRWDGSALEAAKVVEWSGAYYEEVAVSASEYNTLYEPAIFIKTLEGMMRANPGDYVIKGVNGEFYPCKPDIFEKTYEKVDQ